MRYSQALNRLLLVGTGSAISIAASANDAIEEIVVRSEFRAPTLHDAPVSVSVLRVDDVRQTLTNHLEEVLNWAPNVNFASGGSRARFIQIRGIGERGQFAEPLNSSVGLVLDGVDLSGVGTVANLFDVEQVEILRGPQGTLYGANALAGLIHIESKNPEDTKGGSLSFDAGNYDAYGVGGSVNLTLGERAALRLSARYNTDNGFIDNIHLDQEDTNEHVETTLRGKLRVDLSDSWDVLASFGHIDVDNGYDAFSLDNDRNTRSDEPGRDSQTTNYFSLRSHWNTSDIVAIETTLSWADSDISYGYDEDWTFTGFHPFEYSSTDRYKRNRSTLNADLRILSQPDAAVFDGKLDWVVGLYLLRQEVELQRTYTFLPAPFGSEFDIDRIAAYGEVTLHLTDRVRLTTGVRFEQHESDYNDSDGLSFAPKDDLVGGRLVLEADVDDNTLGYFSMTRGYKAGGFNTSGTLDADLREFDPEVLWNFEAGLKGGWLDDRLTLRGALFLMDRDDMQVATSITRVRSDGMTVEFIDFIGNAAQGRNWGFELEGEWQLNERLQLFASLGWLDTELRDYTNGNGDDLDGRAQSQAPDYTFFAGAQYQINDGWFARLEIEGKDDYFVSDSHRERAPSYELINASVGYASDRWHVTLWGRNLSDEDYVVRGFFFGNDPRDGYTARGFNQLGEPRRVGITMGMQF